MEENKQLGIAIGTPIAMMIASVVGGVFAPAAQPIEATIAAAGEQLDPETETILYPYRTPRDEVAAAAKPISKPVSGPAITEPAEQAPKEDLDMQLTVPPAPEIADIAPSLDEEVPAKDPSALDTFLAADNANDDATADEHNELSPSVTPALRPTPETVATTDPAPAEPPPATVTTTPEVSSSSSPVVAAKVIAAKPVDPEPASPPVSTAKATVNAQEVAVVAIPETVVQVAAETPAPAVSEATTDPEAAAASSALPTVLPQESALTSSTAATSTAAKPFLGVGIRDVSGTTVTTVYPKSTAEQLGVKLGDRLLALNGLQVKDMVSIRSAIKNISVGEATSIIVERGGLSYELGPLAMSEK